MKILFLGDVVGVSGCSKLLNNLKKEIESKKIKTRLKKKIILLSSEINQIKFANQRLSKQKLEEMFKKLKEIIEEF